MLLWPRVAVVGGLAAGLGIVGHVSADGLLPGAGALLAVVAVSVALCAPLLREQASGRRLALLLVAGQAWVHTALTVAAGHRDDPTTGAAAHQPAAHQPAAHHGLVPLPEHDGRRVGSLRDAYDSSVSAVPAHPGSFGSEAVGHLVDHAPMMVVHALVAVLVALWLARGERALWTLVALSAGLLHRLLTPPVPLPTDPRPRPAVAARRRPPALVRAAGSPVSRRGPPPYLAIAHAFGS